MKKPLLKNIPPPTKFMSEALEAPDVPADALKLLFAAAYHAHRHIKNTAQYYGTEERATDDITLGNAIFNFASEHFGVDIEDDSRPDEDTQSWLEYFAGATSLEHSSLLVSAVLRSIDSAFEKSDRQPLYVVLFENPYLEEWFEGFETTDEVPQIWSSSLIQAECGWSEQELVQIRELEPLTGLEVFSTSYHTLIRIR